MDVNVNLNGMVVRPGDALAVTVMENLSPEQMNQVSTAVQACLPDGCKVMLFGPGFTLAVLTKDEVDNIAVKDERPHSRACGISCQGHGPICASDCPTCHPVPNRLSAKQAISDFSGGGRHLEPVPDVAWRLEEDQD